jgi:hypothetical protein
MITAIELKGLLNYSLETGTFTWIKSKSNRVKIGEIAGSLRKDGYLHIQINKKIYLAHRLAWFYMTGEWPKEQIDHIDGNRANNIYLNLREVTNAENKQNLKKSQSNNSSQMLGVSPFNNKWVATIQLNGRKIYIGRFNTKEDAHNAYLNKKRELHSFCTI